MRKEEGEFFFMKCITKCTPESQKESNQSGITKIVIYCSIVFIMGLATLIIGSVLDIEKLFRIIFCSCGAMLIICSLVLFLSSFYNIKKTNNRSIFQNQNAEIEYEFLEEYFTVSSKKGNEISGQSRLEYINIFNYKETLNYLYIYTSPTTALPVDKNELSPDELNKLRKYLFNGIEQRKKIKF